MPDCDPLTQRINDSIIAERDRLRKEVKKLRADNRRLLTSAQNLLAFNRELADIIAPKREAPKWPERWSDPTYLGDGPWGA